MTGSMEELERAVSELEAQIDRVKRLTREQGIDRGAEIAELEAMHTQLLTRIFENPTPWDRVRIARNAKRPYTMDFIRLIFQDFLELHGDRYFGDDGAMVGGVARLGDQWVTVVGTQKGRDAQERHHRNFGYARPEGYRKALRLMKLSEQCRRPIVCLVDIPGADCSVPSEERGISEAIARNLREMFLLKVPVLVVITGEGGSGGALGIGIGDRVLMLEYAYYSVIAPEGCAAILWKDAKKAPDAAAALQITASEAKALGVVDEVVPEPLGGAHRDYDAAARNLQRALEENLAALLATPVPEMLETRYQRFRKIARYHEFSSNGTG